jgi:hypothetical protein
VISPDSPYSACEDGTALVAGTGPVYRAVRSPK